MNDAMERKRAENFVTLRTSNAFGFSTAFIAGDQSSALRVDNAKKVIIAVTSTKSGSSGIRIRLRWAIRLGPWKQSFDAQGVGVLATSANTSTGIKSATWFVDTAFGSKGTASSDKRVYVTSCLGNFVQVQALASTAKSAARVTVQAAPVVWDI